MPRAGKQLNQVRLSVPTASTCKAQPAPGSQGPGSDVPQLSPGPDASSWSVAPGLQSLAPGFAPDTHFLLHPLDLPAADGPSSSGPKTKARELGAFFSPQLS